MMGSFLNFWARRRPRRVNCAVLRVELRCREQLTTSLEPEAAVAILSMITTRVASTVAEASGIAHAVDAGDYLIAIPEDLNPNCHIDACRLVFRLASDARQILATAPTLPRSITENNLVAAGGTLGPTLLTADSLPIPIIGETASEAGRLLQMAKSIDVAMLASATLFDRLDSHVAMREHLLGKEIRAWEILRVSEP